MYGMQYGSYMQGSNDGSYIEDSHNDDKFRAVMMGHTCRSVIMDAYAGQ